MSRNIRGRDCPVHVDAVVSSDGTYLGFNLAVWTDEEGWVWWGDSVHLMIFLDHETYVSVCPDTSEVPR